MTIQGTPEEIAALVLALQGRQAGDIPYGDLPYIDPPPELTEKVKQALKEYNIRCGHATESEVPT